MREIDCRILLLLFCVATEPFAQGQPPEIPQFVCLRFRMTDSGLFLQEEKDHSISRVVFDDNDGFVQTKYPFKGGLLDRVLPDGDSAYISGVGGRIEKRSLKDGELQSSYSPPADAGAYASTTPLAVFGTTVYAISQTLHGHSFRPKSKSIVAIDFAEQEAIRKWATPFELGTIVGIDPSGKKLVVLSNSPSGGRSQSILILNPLDGHVREEIIPASDKYGCKLNNDRLMIYGNKGLEIWDINKLQRIQYVIREKVVGVPNSVVILQPGNSNSLTVVDWSNNPIGDPIDLKDNRFYETDDRTISLCGPKTRRRKLMIDIKTRKVLFRITNKDVFSFHLLKSGNYLQSRFIGDGPHSPRYELTIRSPDE